LYKREELFPRELSDEQATWVDRITRQVANEGKWSAFVSAVERPDVIDGVLANEVTHTNTAELGTVLVGWEAWKRLEMPALLERLGFSGDQSLTAAISVINRLVDPCSEHSLLDWYRRTGLPELMDNDLRGAGDDRFYRISDRLLAHKDEIEQHLRQQQMSLFKLKRTVLLYDLTNTHFEGLCQRNPKAKRGRNKQKRHDCPQVVVGMAFDLYGFGMTHRVFEGNLGDSKSLIMMIESLNATVAPQDEKPLVVVDAGIATAENLALLREHGFSYLVNDTRSQRSRYLKQFRQLEEFTVVPERPDKTPVMVRVMDDPCPQTTDMPPERIVLCRSEQRGKKEEGILSNAEKRFIGDVEKLAKRIEKGYLKVPEKIERAIGRVCARHPKVQRFYELALRNNPEGVRLEWQRKDEKIDEAVDLWGCYVLRTNERSLSDHEIWQTYICLTRAEDGFKALKTDLGLRPNRHHKEDRVDGHIFICVLAYHLLRSILWPLEQQDDTRSWESLKRLLSTHCYTTIILPTCEGQIHRIRKAGQPDEAQKAIYQNLNITWNKLPRHHSVINIKQS
jgi:transposase